MVRKVQAYLRNIDDKLIEDESKLMELSEKCEHPPNYMQQQNTHTSQVCNFKKISILVKKLV